MGDKEIAGLFLLGLIIGMCFLLWYTVHKSLEFLSQPNLSIGAQILVVLLTVLAIIVEGTVIAVLLALLTGVAIG